MLSVCITALFANGHMNHPELEIMPYFIASELLDSCFNHNNINHFTAFVPERTW